MKIRIAFCGMVLALLVGCSGSDDMPPVDPAGPNLNTTIDDSHVTREELMGTFPIEFAGVSLGGSAVVEEESATRGSISTSDFAAENFGVYCMSTEKILDAASNSSILLSWSGAVGEKLNLLNLWQNNAKAHVVAAADNTGKIIYDDDDTPRYYPALNYFKYTFVAYHPYSKAILQAKNVLYAYMVVDGDDDVMCAQAYTPYTTYSPDVDAFAYSTEYFKRLTVAGQEITDAYKPYFSFKHLMAKLHFYVKLKQSSSDAPQLSATGQSNPSVSRAPRRVNSSGATFHVDSICFNSFINVVRLMLARNTDGVIESGVLTYGYNPSNLSESLQQALGTSADQTKGHFWLREVDGSSIRDKKVGGTYKYTVNEETFISVGDGIMIPPVTENIGSANIALQVYLSDEDGNRTTSFITLTRPDGGWQAGKEYKVKVLITPPNNAIGQARGDVVEWNTGDEYLLSD